MGFQDYAYPSYSSIDYSFLVDAQLETALQVLINSVAASSTLNTWDELFVDLFSDADGADNTIDTGNTTAKFDTDKYKNIISNNSNWDFTQGSASQTSYCGMRLTTSEAFTSVSIIKEATSDATKCYIYSDSGNSPDAELATANFVGAVATISYAFTSGTPYWFLVDKAGASYGSKRTLVNPGFPRVVTQGTWDRSYQDYARSDYAFDIKDVTSISDTIIQTNQIAIIADPAAHQVYCHNSLSGSASITYNISFDNGSTWVTGQPLNQKNEDVHAGSQMILKLNLEGTGTGNEASANDYGVLLYY